MKARIPSLLVLVCLVLSCCVHGPPLVADDDLKEKAQRLAREFIIIDTHLDVPYRLVESPEDISTRTTHGDFDYPRALEGGLDVPFLAVFVPATKEKEGGAKKLADQLIDDMERIAEEHPDKFAFARSPQDVREQFDPEKLSFVLCIENGAPVEGDLENLKHFYDRGIRYITLAHSRSNHISDSSYDDERQWNGLSPFGKKVVAEMNHLGMMIDVTHVTDDAFYQVLELSRAPVIASHSSCRHFTPGFERNMSDEMIQALAKKGGVIQINFGSSFISEDYRRHWKTSRDEISEYFKENDLKYGTKRAKDYIKKYYEEHPLRRADAADVVDHINHVIALVGVDHVGFGSDFDGVGDSLPTGLRDVSDYPNIIYLLLKRGYSEKDIKKICGENLLRVWTDVERVSRSVTSE